MRPQRIQLQRTKGWRKPADAVIVARPAHWKVRGVRWGNPREVDQPGNADSHREAVEKFRRYLDEQPELVAEARRVLRGRDLACWCSPDLPCHADVWLEVANE